VKRKEERRGRKRRKDGRVPAKPNHLRRRLGIATTHLYNHWSTYGCAPLTRHATQSGIITRNRCLASPQQQQQQPALVTAPWWRLLPHAATVRSEAASLFVSQALYHFGVNLHGNLDPGTPRRRK